MKILVLNGPNLNMLGLREPKLYGKGSYAELEEYIRAKASLAGVEVEIFQSNHEGALVDRIQDAYGKVDAIVINAAAYTHTSLAVLDALKAVRIRTVEVHLTEPKEREEFRRFSYVGQVAERTFAGRGFDSYGDALEYLTGGGRS
jgi:3-dehydroquinate dehydratase-2